jgi:hypothetical protein
MRTCTHEEEGTERVTSSHGTADGGAGGSPVVLHFTMTRDEVKEALRDIALRRPSTLAVAVIGFAGVAIAFISIVIKPDTAALDIAIVALGAFIVGYVIWWMPDRSVEKSPRLLAEKTMTLSDGGIEVQSDQGKSMAPWTLFIASYETKRFYLIRLRQKWGCYIIPKRAIETATAQQGLRALLSRHTQARLR